MTAKTGKSASSVRPPTLKSTGPRDDLPTHPPFSPHTHENNAVTSKKTNMTCENKQLTPFLN
jgi:hypothetical protein